MSHTLMLFDIDMTLLSTGGAGMHAMQAVADRCFDGAISFDKVSFAGKLDTIIFTEAAKLCGLEDIPVRELVFQREYVRELEAELARIGPRAFALPGVLPLLEALLERANNGDGLTLGLLTGNYTAAAPIKLRAVGIDPGWFSITAFGDEAPTRPDLVALAMRKYRQRHGRRIDPARVIVIGDTPRDVECAKAHGCVAFAVATGGYTADQLRDAGADHVVEDLREPSVLLSLI